MKSVRAMIYLLLINEFFVLVITIAIILLTTRESIACGNRSLQDINCKIFANLIEPQVADERL